MFKHNGKFRMRWDLLVIAFTLYNCVLIPFNVAFSEFYEEGLIQQFFNAGIDITFGIDLLLNFRTTFVSTKSNIEVTKPRLVALHYLLYGRFFIDLLAVIPFELLITED